MQNRIQMVAATAGDEDRRMSLQETAYARLRSDIIDGRIAPGASLQEEDLSRNLGVSRTPLREAIRRLAEEGLVTVLPYRGARVLDLKAEQLVELFEVREAIEGMGARLAAERMPQDQIAVADRGVRARLRELRRGASSYRTPTVDFHLAVMLGSGNQLIIDFAQRLYARMTLARTVSGAFHERANAATNEHLAVLGAIQRRHPDTAERLMRRHVRHSRENLQRYFVEHDGMGR